MVQQQTIQLLFHRSQKHQADQIASDLQSPDREFVFIQAGNSDSWSEKVDPSYRLLWLVSDNFLKSTGAMEPAMDVLSKFQGATNLYLIISPGLYPDNDLEIISEVPTRFERMGDIIRYMNYWQTEYLDMRKWKRNLPEEEQISFQGKLDAVQAISGSMGEFLGLLNKVDNTEWQPLVNSNYASLFKYWDEETEVVHQAITTDEELLQLIESASDDLIRENKTLEEPPISLEDIPGMDLLSQTHNAINDLDEKTEGIEPMDEIPREAEIKPNSDHQGDEPEQNNGIMEDDTSDKSWEVKMEAASAALLDGRIEDGIQALETVTTEYPSTVEPKFRLALAVLEYRNDLGTATALLDEVVASEHIHLPARFLLGELAELRQDHASARRNFEAVLQEEPDFPDISYRLGMLMAQHFPEEPALAEMHLKRAIDAEPDRAEAHYQLALLYQERLFQLKKAIKHFKKTRSFFPEHPFVNYDLALIFHQRGKYGKARASYLKAVEVNPELKTPENEVAFRSRKKPVKKKVKAARPVSKTLNDPPVVLITGATSGIGRATAEVFAREGYRLILTGRRADRLQGLQENLEETYGAEKFLIYTFDVRDPQSVEQMVNGLEGRWAEVDILINNAGLAMGLSPVQEGDLDHWNTMIDTNIKGLLYMTRSVSPGMVRRGHGMIINICSTAGKETYPNGNVYAATKHAVDALTKSFRLDLYQHGIRVGQVSPGHVEETEFAVVRFEGDKKKAKIYEDFQPLRSPDVAEAIFFMASRPSHVNVQDVLMMGTQQAGSNFIDRSGR